MVGAGLIPFDSDKDREGVPPPEPALPPLPDLGAEILRLEKEEAGELPPLPDLDLELERLRAQELPPLPDLTEELARMGQEPAPLPPIPDPDPHHSGSRRPGVLPLPEPGSGSAELPPLPDLGEELRRLELEESESQLPPLPDLNEELKLLESSSQEPSSQEPELPPLPDLSDTLKELEEAERERNLPPLPDLEEELKRFEEPSLPPLPDLNAELERLEREQNIPSTLEVDRVSSTLELRKRSSSTPPSPPGRGTAPQPTGESLELPTPASRSPGLFDDAPGIFDEAPSSDLFDEGPEMGLFDDTRGTGLFAEDSASAPSTGPPTFHLPSPGEAPRSPETDPAPPRPAPSPASELARRPPPSAPVIREAEPVKPSRPAPSMANFEAPEKKRLPRPGAPVIGGAKPPKYHLPSKSDEQAEPHKQTMIINRSEIFKDGPKPEPKTPPKPEPPPAAPVTRLPPQTESPVRKPTESTVIRQVDSTVRRGADGGASSVRRTAAAVKDNAPKVSELKASQQDLAVVTRQLAAMLGAGIPIHSALEFCVDYENSTAQALEEVANKVASGVSVSHALRQYPDVFDGVYVGLVQTGEMSGRLPEILEKLAELLERQVAMRQRLISTMTYPSVLGGVAILGVVGFVYFVLPLITPLFDSLGVDLPLPTRILLAFRTVLPYLAFWVLVMALGWRFFHKRIKNYLNSKPALKRKFDAIPVRAPLIGPTWEKIVTSRVLYAMATMVDVGIGMIQAMARSETAAGNSYVAYRMQRARLALTEGATVYESLSEARVFPEAALQLISVGEEAADLGRMFQYVANYYEEEVEYALDTLASLLEPMIMVVMGLVVGFICVSAALPTIQLLQNFS